MNTWTIKKRVLTGFGIILALVAALTVTSYVMLRQAQEAAHFMSIDALPGTIAMSKINGLVGEIQINVLRDLLAKTPEERKKLRAIIDAQREEVLKQMADYEKSITTSDDRELFGKLKVARDQYIVVRNQLLDLIEAGKIEEAIQLNLTSVRPAFGQYMDLVDQELILNFSSATHENDTTIKATDRALTFILGISVVVLIFGIIIATIITLGLNKTMRQLALALDDGSAQVAGAAGQVSSASQSLAEGSSEQASSLEETSASLEEMASMTKRNAENARQANEIAKQAREAADKGAGDMHVMSSAMEAIKVSSDDIAKIIKTIDEIAFQTNILALNAAVEAARAGEAGMGFAVVADEVRNLAQRCAQAAKETAAKIEGAITKTGQGVEISSKVAAALGEIVAKVRQVDELVTEVTNASREQTDGITQINTAVGQMDKVTQSNAANAEESAAAAQELSAQAALMKQSVGELLQLVGGKNGAVANHSAPKASRSNVATITASGTKRLPQSKNTRNGNSQTVAAPAMATSPSRRNEIPLDGDFKDF